ncbi:hypothetical protein C2G38_2169273 [Gigaspora rosea]|uniref:Uncharacterized protein n=1 Tax=Gigaspora rosea TaxID=44941 RepID=A0A397VQY7_9GLOM|nr:hypothetical protein C2G38_2169273 [Gigaspora rosea]
MVPLLTNVSISVEYDLEDYEGASYKDAFDDLLYPLAVEWPNEAYREFMEIVNKYQLSNSAGDSIINFFNKYSSLDVSPLSSSTRIGKEFLDNTIIPHMMFKGIPITMFQNNATTLDHMGKSSSHPIFLSLGNIPNYQRNKPESKALIGYLPILKAKNTKTKNSKKFRKAVLSLGRVHTMFFVQYAGLIGEKLK